MNAEAEKKTPVSGWRERHAHLFLSGSRKRMKELFQTDFPDFQHWRPSEEKSAFQLGKRSEEKSAASATGIDRLNLWIRECFLPATKRSDWRKLAVQAALEQAQSNGVARLEASLNVDFCRFGAERLLWEIAEVHAQTVPEMELKLDLGFVRSASAEFQTECFLTFLKTADKNPRLTELLGGIDLYDVEFAAPPENFRNVFQTARRAGLTLKAHVGESGNAESVRRTVEILDLDEVQHGIRAGESRDVLAFLAERGTILNLSPASNVILRMLDRNQVLERIRAIFDAGVAFTISTDDYLLFNSSISSQIQAISPCFSPEELALIQKNCRAV